MTKKKTYKIIFMQLGEIYEIFAKQIYQSDMSVSYTHLTLPTNVAV